MQYRRQGLEDIPAARHLFHTYSRQFGFYQYNCRHCAPLLVRAETEEDRYAYILLWSWTLLSVPAPSYLRSGPRVLSSVIENDPEAGVIREGSTSERTLAHASSLQK